MLDQERIRSLLCEARELPPSEVSAFLASLSDAEREAIEDMLPSLVNSERCGGSLDATQDLKTPAEGISSVQATPPETDFVANPTADNPETIGPFRILQKIGSGGMGQVYMAEQQQPVRRRVALKVVKTDTPSKEILARFEAERQALAMMDHQNIAKVLDAGVTDSGLPYFAMELVKGEAITEYCDKHRLSTEHRLDLFVQACRAIQHAHQKGILHRDIKPSNLLVTLYDGKPVAKVIDFGLAKALYDTTRLTDKTMFTQLGQVVGTLAYMSPEQAEMTTMDVDTRTDVYSLGVVFYELLTGETPLSRERIRSTALDAVLRLIREEEVVRPSSRLSSLSNSRDLISSRRRTDPRKLSLILKGDLDWIAIKALEKDRSRRYDGASALGDDVQRFLSGEAINARPPSFNYRFQKYVKRNRGLVVSLVAIFILLLAGCMATSYLWLDSLEMREVAERKSREANVNAEDAKQSAAQAIAEQRKTERLLARSNFLVATSRWDANRCVEARQFLERVPPEYRDLEWALAQQVFEGSDLTCTGHTGEINSIVFADDGASVFSGSDDGTIRKWDAATGDEIFRVDAHSEGVNAICLEAAGSIVCSGGQDGAVRAWDGASGRLLRDIDAHSASVVSVALDFDGRHLEPVFKTSCGDGSEADE